MDLYLAVMSGIFNDRSQQMHARLIRGEGLAYMPLDTVAPVVDQLLPIIGEVKLTTFRYSVHYTQQVPTTNILSSQSTDHASIKRLFSGGGLVLQFLQAALV